MSLEPKVIYSKARLAARIAALGKQVSKDYKDRTVDAVIILEDGFVFAADLLRAVSRPVVCHFVRLEMRDVELSGFSRREVSFTRPPDLKDRDILIVASMLHTGVTIDFLCKRLQESRPRSLRIAVLLDKPEDRRVDLQPDYFGFLGASNRYVGYGLADHTNTSATFHLSGLLSASARQEAKLRSRRVHPEQSVSSEESREF